MLCAFLEIFANLNNPIISFHLHFFPFSFWFTEIFLLGVIANYHGPCPPAFQGVIHSSVPTGGGLSSSAAIEVATYTFLDALTGGAPEESYV